MSRIIMLVGAMFENENFESITPTSLGEECYRQMMDPQSKWQGAKSEMN